MEIDIKQRNRIADAFERHFIHYGFRKTTVDDVAAELGSSKKTIYNYFKSKDEIFYYVISRKATARREMIEKKIVHLKSADAKMEAMIRINFEEFRKIHKRKKNTAFADRAQSEIASGAFREAFKHMVSDIISEGVANKEFEICDHDMTVRYIQVLISETVMKLMESSEARPEDFLVFTVKKLLNKNE